MRLDEENMKLTERVRNQSIELNRLKSVDKELNSKTEAMGQLKQRVHDLNTTNKTLYARLDKYECLDSINSSSNDQVVNRYEALLHEACEQISVYEAQVVALVSTNLSHATMLRETDANTQELVGQHGERFTQCVKAFTDGLQRPMQLSAVNDFIATLDGMRTMI